MSNHQRISKSKNQKNQPILQLWTQSEDEIPQQAVKNLPLRAENVLQLQRTLGNQLTRQLIQRDDEIGNGNGFAKMSKRFNKMYGHELKEEKREQVTRNAFEKQYSKALGARSTLAKYLLEGKTHTAQAKEEIYSVYKMQMQNLIKRNQMLDKMLSGSNGFHMNTRTFTEQQLADEFGMWALPKIINKHIREYEKDFKNVEMRVIRDDANIFLKEVASFTIKY